MKTKLFLFLMLILIQSDIFAQQKDIWAQLRWLTGDWIGEGSGQPGQGSGSFSFSLELDNNILVRKSHSEFPAAGSKPATTHNDLMIIYKDITGNPSRAIYFDNEGHVINYSVSYAEKSIIMTSEKSPNSPVFRLTYTLLQEKTVITTFEMSQDGVKFTPYIEGKSRKMN